MYIDKIRNDMSILRYTLEWRLRECKDKGDWLYSWIDCFCWRCCCDIFSLFSYCFTFVLKHSNFIIIRHIICTYHDHETKNIQQHHHDLHPWKSQGTWPFQLTTDCLQISIMMVVAVLRLWGIFVAVSQDNWVVLFSHLFKGVGSTTNQIRGAAKSQNHREYQWTFVCKEVGLPVSVDPK